MNSDNATTQNATKTKSSRLTSTILLLLILLINGAGYLIAEFYHKAVLFEGYHVWLPESGNSSLYMKGSMATYFSIVRPPVTSDVTIIAWAYVLLFFALAVYWSPSITGKIVAAIFPIAAGALMGVSLALHPFDQIIHVGGPGHLITQAPSKVLSGEPTQLCDLAGITIRRRAENGLRYIVEGVIKSPENQTDFVRDDLIMLKNRELASDFLNQLGIAYANTCVGTLFFQPGG